MDFDVIPVKKSWAAQRKGIMAMLQGLNKTKWQKKYGDDQVALSGRRKLTTSLAPL